MKCDKCGHEQKAGRDCAECGEPFPGDPPKPDGQETRFRKAIREELKAELDERAEARRQERERRRAEKRGKGRGIWPMLDEEEPE